MRIELPSQQVVEWKLMEFLAGFIRPVEAADVYDPLAQLLSLSAGHLALQRADGRNAWSNLVQFAKQRLVEQGYMLSSSKAGHNAWVLTPKGRSEVYERAKNKDKRPDELGL